MLYTFGSLLLFGAFILSMFAQSHVQRTYEKYARVQMARGLTGYQVAEMILRSHGLTDISIVRVPGRLTDHFDPKAKKVGLSEGNYSGSSLAAAAISAHEIGHVLQYASGMGLIRLRTWLMPAVIFSQSVVGFVILAGFILRFVQLIDIGIVLFSIVVLFQFLTLPVEFDASNRALRALTEIGILVDDELPGAKNVLQAAALTYVAGLLVSLAQLLRFIGMRGSRD